MNILLYVSNILIVLSFVSYFLILLINRNKKITDSDGFNITKDILNEYDSINIVESKSYFTVYNIKRKVIKIASMCYYANTLGYLLIPLMEAAISVVDNKKNRFINFCRYFLGNLKILYLLPIIAMFINNVTYTISDARVSVLFLSVFLIVMYMIINIKQEGISIIGNKIDKLKDINKANKSILIKSLYKLLFLDKVICFGELIMLFRFVMILLGK